MKRRWKGTTLAPPRPLGRESLEQADRRLLRSLASEFEIVARGAGPWLACRPGCSECCIGPFPITRLDAWRLRRGIERLRAEEPDRAAAVIHRALRAVRTLAEGYPGEAGTGRLESDEQRLDRFIQRHETLACPALDPDSGRCDVYDWRPVSCRSYGPPARFGSEEAPPCRLCFNGAPADFVKSCRMEPDRQGVEQSLLAAMGVTGGSEWETFVAFALIAANDAGGRKKVSGTFFDKRGS